MDSAAPKRSGVTLIEMLIATAITLVMMAAVVTVFANISGSVSRNRAGIELNNQLRRVRTILQTDLDNATCPPTTWQRPEANQGYFEIIEGPRSDMDPSIWLGAGVDGRAIDLSTSTLPSSVIPDPSNPDQMLPAGVVSTAAPAGVATDGLGLGDWDDILMFTIKTDPMEGRIPVYSRRAVPAGAVAQMASGNPRYEIVESSEAEVIWFAVENPVEANRSFHFGEPGYRTIYRRELLIAPWVRAPLGVDGMQTGPGVLRVLDYEQSNVSQAIADFIRFQNDCDISMRLEWDPLLGNNGAWVFRANSLSDLAKRESRFEHYPYKWRAPFNRSFPFPAASMGSGAASLPVIFRATNGEGAVAAVSENGQTFTVTNGGSRYYVRPFCFVASDGLPIICRAIVSGDAEVVHVTTGFVPLGGQRRGQDIMLTEALAFDVRAYDPGAPRYAYAPDPAAPPVAMVSPGDPGWAFAYQHDVVAQNASNPTTGIGDSFAEGQNQPWGYAGSGAYVDLGYGELLGLPPAGYAGVAPPPRPLFFEHRALPNNQGQPLAPGFAVYDTWPTHYENNGLDDDGDGLIDEGANGLDDPANYPDQPAGAAPERRYGPDDPGERETTPPYDTPLRGVQVTIRAYERDSRQIREATVRKSLVPN